MHILALTLAPLIGAIVVLLGMIIAGPRVLLAWRRRSLQRAPDTLTLKPRTAGWKDQQLMDTIAAPLLTRGFKEVGSFMAAELPGSGMRFLLKEDDSALAAVFENAQAGHWLEIASYYLDGTSVVYSTSALVSLFNRPGHVRVNALGLNSGALYTKFKAERPGGPMTRLTKENVAAQFANAYASEIAWRKQRGLQPEEIARMTRGERARGGFGW